MRSISPAKSDWSMSLLFWQEPQPKLIRLDRCVLGYNSTGSYDGITLNDAIVHHYRSHSNQYIILDDTTMDIVSNWDIIAYDCRVLFYVQWITAPSWMFTLFPILMKFTSPNDGIKPNTTGFSKTYHQQ
jgi:hypothetical protein